MNHIMNRLSILYILTIFNLHLAATSAMYQVDILSFNKLFNNALVFIDEQTQESIVTLAHILPDHRWSPLFKNVYYDFLQEGNVTLFDIANHIIDESLSACNTLKDDVLQPIKKQLVYYQHALKNGHTYLCALKDETQDTPIITRKTEDISRLNVGSLNVCGHLFVNGIDFTHISSAGGSGQTGPTGPTGPTGTNAPANIAFSNATSIDSCLDSILMDIPLAQFITTVTITNAPLATFFSYMISQTTTVALLADDCQNINLNLALMPKGNGALTAAIPDGTTAGGNIRGQYAVDWQMVRNDPSQIASGAYAVIAGGAYNTASGNYAAIAGGSCNQVTADYGSISGGFNNQVTAEYGAIGGGGNNTCSQTYATIAGGSNNTASGNYSTISGGSNNTASGDYSTISGGSGNQALGAYSTITGGQNNIAGNEYDTVCGGFGNISQGGNSFAAGTQSGSYNLGSFVWSDSIGGATDTSSDQFVVQANGGTTFYTSPNAFNANGGISASSKSFDIPHPNPEKSLGTRLRHCCVESPTAGDNIYRYIAEVKNGLAEIQLPDYFSHLNGNVQAWVFPVNTFGSCYAQCDTKKVTVHATIDGTYNVLIIGTRIDPFAIESWGKTGVEYVKNSSQ